MQGLDRPSPPILYDEMLSNEIRIQVFGYLEARQLKRTREVCKLWKTLADSPQLWSNLYSSNFSSFAQNDRKIDRESYISRYRTECNFKAGRIQRITHQQRFSGEIHPIRFSEDGSHVVTAFRKGGGFQVADLTTGADYYLSKWDDTQVVDMILAGNRAAIIANDHQVHIWNFLLGTRQALKGHTDKVWNVVFSPNQQYLVTASLDQTARVWELDTEKCYILSGHTAGLYCATFYLGEDRVATAARDQTVRIWNFLEGTHSTYNLNNDAYSVRFSPNGNRLVIALRDHTVQVLDLVRQEISHIFTGHTAEIVSSTFSHDGTKLATLSRDRTVRVWNLFADSKEKEVDIFHERENWVHWISFSPNDQFIVTAAIDTTYLRDLAAKKAYLLKLPKDTIGRSTTIHALKFSVDGDKIHCIRKNWISMRGELYTFDFVASPASQQRFIALFYDRIASVVRQVFAYFR